MLYAVIQSELEDLSNLNDLATLFFSFGAGFGGYAGSLAKGILEKEVYASLELCISLGVVAIVFFGLGIVMWVKRGSLLKEIKKHTTTVLTQGS